MSNFQLLAQNGESFKHSQSIVDSEQQVKFLPKKETTQYPRSLASNATTDHTTHYTLDRIVGALSAQSTEDNQPMYDSIAMFPR